MNRRADKSDRTTAPTLVRPPRAPDTAAADRWTPWADAIVARYGRIAQRRLGPAMLLAMPAVPLHVHTARWTYAAWTLAPRIHLAIHPIVRAESPDPGAPLASAHWSGIGRPSAAGWPLFDPARAARGAAPGLGRAVLASRGSGGAGPGFAQALPVRGGSGGAAPGLAQAVPASGGSVAVAGDAFVIATGPAPTFAPAGMLFAHRLDPAIGADRAWVAAGSDTQGGLPTNIEPAAVLRSPLAPSPLQRVFVRAGAAAADARRERGAAGSAASPTDGAQSIYAAPIHRPQIGLLAGATIAERVVERGRRVELRSAHAMMRTAERAQAGGAAAAGAASGPVQRSVVMAGESIEGGDRVVDWSKPPPDRASPGMPPALDVARLADQVIRQLDQRLLAQRERMGRSH